MIREFLSFVTARASSHARRFGYVQESIAIDARYRRCAKAWASHLHSCHSAIGEAIRRCPGHDRAVVLGSGALYDIPLPHLAGSFREVVLLDIYHPPKARRQMRQWPNVRAIECDLLGLAEPALATVQAPLLSAWRQQIGAVDLVISSNLLTQLPLLPLSRLGPQAVPADWPQQIMAAHLQDLGEGPGQVCLITEWCRRWQGEGGLESHREMPLGSILLPKPLRQWQWDIAPKGELYKKESLVLDVGWYNLNS